MTTANAPTVLNTGLRAINLGLSAIPIKADGTKRPDLSSWTEFTLRQPTSQEIIHWFKENPRRGLGLVCGVASGHLELFEFDDLGTYHCFKEVASRAGFGDLVEKVEAGFSEETPGGGIHWWYKCPEVEIPGNTKLAQRPLVDKTGQPVLLPNGRPDLKVLIETRGQGGQGIIAPSSGKVHPTGNPYLVLKGSLETITTITEKERRLLWQLAESLDEMPRETTKHAPLASPPPSKSGDDLRPGDDFNHKATWAEILEPTGWKFLYTSAGESYWKRPGKNTPGISAKTGHIGRNGEEVFCSYSSSTEFEMKVGYNKFAVYTMLHHNNDFTASAKALGSKGYGNRKPKLSIDFKGDNVDRATGEVLGDSFLAEFSADDDGNAEAFLAVYGKGFLYCKAYGWLWHNNCNWQIDLAEQKLFEKITEVLKRRRVAGVQAEKEAVVKCSKPNSATINNTVNLLEKKLEVLVDTFDKDPDLLNCNNGVLNLRTGQLEPHSPDQRYTYCFPTDYDPMARSQEWENFLNSVVGGGPVVLDYLQQALGYTLTGYTTEECLFYLYGPTRSGKGTLTELLMTLMGRPLSAEADFNTFTARRDGDSNNFDLAPLKPARAVFASESERYQRLNPAKIKQLTGGNMVYCAFKHRDMFNYRPQYKLWLSSNWPVNGDVDDDALWGRVRVISFPNSFLNKEDKSLKIRLKRKDNLKAVFAWLVQGAMKWYAAPNGLETPVAITEATTKQREESDFVQSWLDENCEQDQTSWESNANVYSDYERWCKSNGVEAKQMRNLTASLKTKGYLTNIPKKESGALAKGIQGIRIPLKI